MQNERLTEIERQIVEDEFKAINILIAGYPVENSWEVRVYLKNAGFRRKEVELELRRRVQKKFGMTIKVKLRQCRYPENNMIELKLLKQRKGGKNG